MVNLARNKLQGPIPTQLENVNVIDLTLNNFVGSIPSQIGEALGIRPISLSGNKTHGSIPESFCHASNVHQVLDLSNNSLSGTIRRNLGNCKSLIYLNLGQNKLTGSVPEEVERVTSLRYLDLNGNQFKGSFPAVIENFQDLEILNLAGNRFEGKIPKFIGDLRSLRTICPVPFLRISMAKRQNEATILGYVYSLKFTGAQLEIVTKGRTHWLESVYSYNTGFDLSSNVLT
ncbi:receptor-like protein kinase 5, partial [Capsicum annuum]|uniref:receptor-like protein kinase 5 n=1 Tax=Capsicum annuum TaxID=4072 RepID=UPI001FB13926